MAPAALRVSAVAARFTLAPVFGALFRKKAGAAKNPAQARQAKLNLLFSRVFLERGRRDMVYFPTSQNFLAKFDPPLFRVPLMGL